MCLCLCLWPVSDWWNEWRKAGERWERMRGKVVASTGSWNGVKEQSCIKEILGEFVHAQYISLLYFPNHTVQICVSSFLLVSHFENLKIEHFNTFYIDPLIFMILPHLLFSLHTQMSFGESLQSKLQTPGHLNPKYLNM